MAKLDTDASRGDLTTVMVAVFLIAAATRVALALTLPQVSPDGLQYIRVGENIALNGCISLSAPETGACVPHWGGNHPPGYPILLAIGRFLGATVPAALVMQSVLVALAIAYMSRTLTEVSGRLWVGVAAGVLLTFSPVHFAWSRFILPDTLAVAGTIWVGTELLLSLHQRRFRTTPLAIAFVAAFFARYDSIILVVPIAIAAFLVHSPLLALRKGIVCAVIISVPIGAWSIRNVSQGLSFVPDPFLQDGGRSPKGYLAWGNTWIVSIYDGAGMAYPLQNRDYGSIRINEARAFRNETEKQAVSALLNDLSKSSQGQSFPLDIDNRFSVLAAERRAEHPLGHYFLLPLRRTLEFWATPFSSFAWPLELEARLSDEDRSSLSRGGFRGIAEVALRHPSVALGKAVVFGYRILLLGSLFVLAPFALGNKGTLPRFAALCIGYAILRTWILSSQLSIDSRYIIEAAALLEAAAVAMLIVFTARKRRHAQGANR